MKFIFKPIYWSYRVAGGTWYWTRRRFTFAGMAAVVALLVTGAVGVDIENTVTYQALAFLVALVAFAFACSFFFRAKFSATRLLPRLGTAGQPLVYLSLIHI